MRSNFTKRKGSFLNHLNDIPMIITNHFMGKLSGFQMLPAELLQTSQSIIEQ